MAMPLRKIATIVLHVVPWTLLLLGPFSSNFFASNLPRDVQVRALIIFTVFIGLFYLNYSLLVPRLLFRRKFAAYILSILAIFLSVSLLRNYTNPFGMEGSAHLQLVINGQVVTPVPGLPPPFAPIGVIILVVTGLAARLTGRWLQQDRIHREISREQLQMELSLLKNQVSPHFFFNTLNNVYALTGSDPERAREVIHRLSRIMRYLLYESEKPERATLAREISLLEDYVELNRIRLPEHLEIRFEHSNDAQDCQLPPLLFLPLVENAFKHGISLQHASKVEIGLHRHANQIEFTVANSIHQAKETQDDAGGIGLANIRRRLELLYPNDSYRLDISREENTFRVYLKIPVHEDQLHRR